MGFVKSTHPTRGVLVRCTYPSQIPWDNTAGQQYRAPYKKAGKLESWSRLDFLFENGYVLH